MIRKKNLFVVAAVVLLTAVAVEGAGIWLAGVDAPLTYDEEAAYVETMEATNITKDSADLEGELVHIRGHDTVNLYFEYREEGTENGWTRVDSKENVDSSMKFNETLENLDTDTTYEYRAIVENTEVLDEGEIVTFTTVETVETSEQTELLGYDFEKILFHVKHEIVEDREGNSGYPPLRWQD